MKTSAPRNFDDATKKKIIEKYQYREVSVTALAREYDTTRATIYAILREGGVEEFHSHQSVDEETVKQVLSLLKRRKTRQSIANELGLPAWKVGYIRRKYGDSKA